MSNIKNKARRNPKSFYNIPGLIYASPEFIEQFAKAEAEKWDTTVDIPTKGAGIMKQIANIETYTTMTIEKLEATIDEIFNDKI